MLIRRAEIDGNAPRDVRIDGERIAAIATSIPAREGEEVLDGKGAALLPGLHDHHIHLFALARALGSVRCGPPQVTDEGALAAALAAARDDEAWVRGVGYHDSVAGALDRHVLDRLIANRPVRVQHRGGALWVVNSVAAQLLGLDAAEHPGIERDEDGRANGRLLRADDWLRERLGTHADLDLAAVGTLLARAGVTGVTDATATNGPAELDALRRAQSCGALPQRLVVMGAEDLPHVDTPRLARGPLKVLLDEPMLPPLDALCARIAAAHDAGRNVAFHCVTRAELVFATTAIASAGGRAGDRIEHASVTPPELADLVREQELTVVTQPGFIFERGDAYLNDVAEAELPWLYRGRGFLDAGIPLAASTDAPFGEPAPWRAMQSAADRSTRDGHVLGGDEGLTPEQALSLFTGEPANPGGAPRRVEVGATADLCLLDLPWAQARPRLAEVCVAATIVGGKKVWP